jgi:integrase
MASVSNDGGLFRVLWVDGDRRLALRLGRVSQRHAEDVARHVEELMRAKQTRHPVDGRTVAWLTNTTDDLHRRLSDAGLCLPRATGTLGGLLRLVLAERKADLKPESLRRLQQTADKLIAALGDDRALHTITPADAAHWRAELTRAGLSMATVKAHVGNAKTLIGEAVRRGILTTNPLAGLKGGVTAHRSGRIVSAEELAKVIDAAPSLEWKCIIGLAGWAGLRHPSETSLVRWADVDFAAGRLRVRSPKTERHPGHAERLVPIEPALAALLQAQYDAAPEGTVNVVNLTGRGGRRRTLAAIIRRAGLEPWPDLWQTLRRSCEVRWATVHPQFAVSKWIGHSLTVSGRHYANVVPDELFQRVSGQAAQKAAQHPPEPPRTIPQAHQTAGSVSSAGSVGGAEVCGGVRPRTGSARNPNGNGAGGNRTPVSRRSAWHLYACIR